MSSNNADSIPSFDACGPSINRFDSSINEVAAGELTLAWTLADALFGGNGGAFLPKFMMVKIGALLIPLVLLKPTKNRSANWHAPSE